MKISLFNLLMILFLSGCSSISKNIINAKSFDENKAVIFYSMGYDSRARGFDAYNLHYKSTLTREEGDLFAVPDNPFISKSNVINENNEVVQVKAAEIPEGEYEFIKHEAFTDNGMYSRSMKNKSLYSVKFKIEKGKLNYLGSLIFYPTKEGGKFVIRNKMDRDLNKLTEINPYFSQINTINTNLNYISEDAKKYIEQEK